MDRSCYDAYRRGGIPSCGGAVGSVCPRSRDAGRPLGGSFTPGRKLSVVRQCLIFGVLITPLKLHQVLQRLEKMPISNYNQENLTGAEVRLSINQSRFYIAPFRTRDFPNARRYIKLLLNTQLLDLSLP